MPASGIRLVDSNVWLALTFGDHVHHRAACRWFEGVGRGEAAFCRVTQMALMRHLTNSKIMGRFVLGQRETWKVWDELAGDERVIYLDEPAGVTAAWRRLTGSDEPRHAAWTDAYLAVFALSSRITMATFDKGFRSFGGLALDLIATE